MQNRISQYMENYASNDKSRKKLLFCFIIMTFLIMLVLNFNTGYMADDYTYIHSKSFLDVLKDEYHQYMNWGGRSVVHILARTFLMLPKFIFNIANALVYTWLTVLIYLHCNYKKKTKASLYLFIASCCWLFIPVFGQTVFWVTGACNYLWGTTIILTFLLPYRIYVNKKPNFLENKKTLMIIIMFFGGIVAGWCNENTSGGSLLFVILILLYCFFNKIKIKLWLVSGLIGNIIGFAFMMLSPGNAIRSENFVNENSKIVNLIINLVGCTQTIANLFMPLLTIFAILLVICFLKQKDIKTLIFPFVYLLVGFAITYAMCLSPTGPNEQRAFFGASIFFILGISSILSNLDLSINFNKIFVYILTVVLFMQYCSSVFNASVDIIHSNNIYKQREVYIAEQKQLGNTDIILPEIVPLTKYNSLYGIGDVSKSPDFWINGAFAKYYNLNSVKTISYDDWRWQQKQDD